MIGAWKCPYCRSGNVGETRCRSCGAARPADSLSPTDHTWTDPETGYQCSIRMAPHGYWLGYVVVPSSTAADEIAWLEMGWGHGGVSWTDDCFPNEEPLPGKVVIGFDCAQAGDAVPGLPYGGVWRDAAFAADGCRGLAQALSELAAF